MKYALMKWYNYFIGLGLYVIAALSAILPRVYAIRTDGEFNYPPKWISYVFFFSMVIFALVGFIIQDLYRGYIRHKINDWDNELENKYINKAWMIYLPFLIAAVLCLVSGAIFSLKFIQF